MPIPFLPVRYRDSCEWLKHSSETGGAPATYRSLGPYLKNICLFCTDSVTHMDTSGVVNRPTQTSCFRIFFLFGLRVPQGGYTCGYERIITTSTSDSVPHGQYLTDNTASGYVFRVAYSVNFVIPFRAFLLIL